MEREKYVIIGGDAAGMSAAGQIRKLQPKAEIVAYERSPHTSYSACGMPYYIAGLVEKKTNSLFGHLRSLCLSRTYGPLCFTKCSVDIQDRTVNVLDLKTGEVFADTFDHLLFATGSEPIRPAVEGLDGEEFSAERSARWYFASSIY